jgi:hypothetical protein
MIFFFALHHRRTTDSLLLHYEASSIVRFFLLPVLISLRDLVAAVLSCSSRGGRPQPHRSFASIFIFIFATPTGPPRDDQLLPLRGANLPLAPRHATAVSSLRHAGSLVAVVPIMIASKTVDGLICF